MKIRSRPKQKYGGERRRCDVCNRYAASFVVRVFWDDPDQNFRENFHLCLAHAKEAERTPTAFIDRTVIEKSAPAIETGAVHRLGWEKIRR